MGRRHLLLWFICSWNLYYLPIEKSMLGALTLTFSVNIVPFSSFASSSSFSHSDGQNLLYRTFLSLVRWLGININLRFWCIHSNVLYTTRVTNGVECWNIIFGWSSVQVKERTDETKQWMQRQSNAKCTSMWAARWTKVDHKMCATSLHERWANIFIYLITGLFGWSWSKRRFWIVRSSIPPIPP